MGAGQFHEAAEPVNEGEIEVLRRLRDDLDETWFVVGNFEFEAPGNRWYECDALALCSAGYGYLIETKAWRGRIVGNDKSWLLPSLDGSGRSSRQPPIHVLTSKQKKLASRVKAELPVAGSFRLDPLVVVVTDDELELTGKSEFTTVTHDEMVERLRVDPRTDDQRSSANVSPEVARTIFEHLTATSRPPRRDVLGDFVLDEQLELRLDGVEVWRAHPSADSAISCILKRYPIDLLAPPENRAEQLALARQHHTVINELDDSDVVPLWGAPFEVDGDFVVVSREPRGRTLDTVLNTEDLSPTSLDALFTDLLRVLAHVHARGVVHRWIRPHSIWIDENFRVRLADFDIGRVTGTQGVTGIVLSEHFDHEYAAPEVQADLGRATKSSDLYSVAAIAEVAYGKNLEAASPRLRDTLRKCLEEVDGRPTDAGEALRSIERPDARLASDELQTEDVIDDRYVVRSRHDSGGLTVVYRVFDPLLQRDFGAKFVRSQYRDQLQALTEFQLLDDVPPQENIAKPTFVGHMRRIKRRTNVFTCHDTFLLTPWIEGRALDEYLDQTLPVRRVLEIGQDLAAGLAHLHSHGILHRDIKPENVLIGEDQTAVILDFNVSTPNSLATQTSLGTAPYRAPEATSLEWSAAADVYSLGVCLIELIAGRRLGSEALTWLTGSNALPDDASELLAALVDPDPTRRGEAAAVRSSLESLIADFRPRPSEIGTPPDLGDREVGNPYAERIMEYFSQSSISNAGTRGLDGFGQWLYVDTQIDETLRPVVMAGDVSLVIITGNAGDGKTAFIRRVENELLARGATRRPGRANNGSLLEHDGHEWATNWDGSQDEADVDNHEVLTEFFQDFARPTPSSTPGKTAVVAINEGRLVDFLESAEERFASFSRIIHDAIAGHRDPPSWMVLVNLNRRVLTRQGEDNLTARLLRKLSDERMWADCARCPALSVCPNPSNAHVLRDPVLGERAMERIREVLDVVRLRRRLHITTRDLLSVLAYVTVGNQPCETIIEEAEKGAPRITLDGQLYNRLFAASDPTSDGAGQDRLLAEVALLNPADTPHPELDGRLWLLGTDALPKPAADSALNRDRGIIESLRSSDAPAQMSAHQSLLRKVFLEREEPDYITLLPFQSLADFQSALSEPTPELRDEIAVAISASEGLRRDVPEVAVRLVDDTNALDRSYVRRPAASFDLTVVDERSAAGYVEYEPDLLRLQARDHESLSLDIDVDIFEALARMNTGFTPSREDLRGSWLSLATFKERLAALPSKELLLQSRTGDLTEIAVGELGDVIATALR